MQKWQKDMISAIMMQSRPMGGNQRMGMNGNWRQNPKGPPKQAAQVTEKKVSCQCCGRDNHTRKNCRRSLKECNSCGKTGHLSAMCRTGPNPAARIMPSTARDAIAAKKRTPIATSPGATESKQWLCQVCLYFTPQSENSCSTEDCKGKRPQKEKTQTEHITLKPKIKELLAADEEEEEELQEDDDDSDSLDYLLEIKATYEKGKFPPPPELLQRIERKQAKAEDGEEEPTVDEQILTMKERFDAQGEVLRITRIKSTKVLKNHKATEASQEEQKRIQAKRAERIKEEEEAHRLKMIQIKEGFDAAELRKKTKLEDL